MSAPGMGRSVAEQVGEELIMGTPFIITRIGSVEGNDSRAHFMRGYASTNTACGKRAVSAWGCTKDSAISSVDCPECWEIKHTANGGV